MENDVINNLQLPNDILSEQFVIGSMLLSEDAMFPAIEVLKPEDFYGEDNKEIFSAMLDIYFLRKPIDFVTVSEQLKLRGTLDKVGGNKKLAELIDNVPNNINIEHYIKNIKEKSIEMKLIFDVSGEKKLVTIGGRCGIGKTTFVLDFATFVAINKKIPVLMFSLGISKEEIAKRIICNEGKIEYSKIEDGTLDMEDWRKIGETTKKLLGLQLYICDKPNISIDYIIKESKKMKYKEDIGLIIIDYIQLLDYDEDKKEEIPYLLKKLAKELEVPIIVTSQLSRKVEKRKDKIPILEDLNYKSLVENSDVVMLLNSDNKSDTFNLTISKNENGTLGTIEL